MKVRTSEPSSKVSGIDEMKLSDVAAQKESASRGTDARMEDMTQRMEVVMKQTSEAMLQSASAQINGITQRSKK